MRLSRFVAVKGSYERSKGLTCKVNILNLLYYFKTDIFMDDYEVLCSAPARLYGASLYRTLHYHPFIVSK